MNISTRNHNHIFAFNVPRKIELHISARGIGFTKPKSTMVGERIRREPWGETKKLKGKKKVWHKLEKGV